MLANLKKAARDRETVKVGGGEFSPAEVKAFIEAIELQREMLGKLIEHTMHYAAMPLAHADAHKDIANARAAESKEL